MDSNKQNLIKQLTRRLGIENENVVNKSAELLRLIQLKPNGLTANLSDYGKVTLCIHLASKLLGSDIDMENAIKLSGLKKTQYLNYVRTFEKMLDLNKPLDIHDICVRLGINPHIEKMACSLLGKYRTFSGLDTVDLAHPQYVTMAIHQSCKHEKFKLSKSKLIAFGHLKPAQWATLEKSWDKWLETVDMRKNVDKKSEPDVTSIDIIADKSENQKPTVEYEEYEVWKERMLKKAYEILASQDKLL